MWKLIILQSSFTGYNIILCFGANNLNLQGATCANEAHIHYRRFTITFMYIIFLAISGDSLYPSRYNPFPIPVLPSLSAEKHPHSDSQVLCQKIKIFRIISPKSIQLPEMSRRQESLKHCNNYGATSTCFVVREKKILQLRQYNFCFRCIIRKCSFFCCSVSQIHSETEKDSEQQ